MSNRYFVMRHGESLANRKGLIVCQPINALNGFGLTAFGAEQVLHSAVNTRLKQNTVIVSSDFLRARETAEIVHRVICCQSDILYDKSLRERDFGELELLDDGNYRRVWDLDEAIIIAPERVLAAAIPSISGLEPVQAVLDRSLKLLQKLDETHKNRDILLVGHGDVLQILLAHWRNSHPSLHRSLPPIKNAEIRALRNGLRKSA